MRAAATTVTDGTFDSDGATSGIVGVVAEGPEAMVVPVAAEEPAAGMIAKPRTARALTAALRANDDERREERYIRSFFDGRRDKVES